MAVTARFLADFTSFTTQVEKAIITARKFETSIDKVETSLDRMTDSFSGRKIIEQASLAARAIDEIGGASKLTASEQQRVGAQVTEALAKFRAMGQEAPASILKLDAALKQQLSTLTKTGDSVSFLNTKMIALGSAVGSFVGNLGSNALQSFGQFLQTAATDGAKFSALAVPFERLATSVNSTGEAMLAVTRSATKGLITDLDLMQSANKAMLLGLPVTAAAMGDMSKAAVTLGRAMGQDATKSLDDMITALGRSSPLILDNLGLTVKVGEANKVYAAQLGKSVDALTDVEKKTAFYNAAMSAARDRTEELGEVALTAADQITRIANGISNLTTKTLSNVNESKGLIGVLDKIADAAEQATTRLEDFTRAQRASFEGRSAIDELTRAGLERSIAIAAGTQQRPVPKAGDAALEFDVAARLGHIKVLEDIAALDKKDAENKRLSAAAARDAAAAAKSLADEVERLAKEYQAWIAKFRNAEGEAMFAKLASEFSGVQSAIDAGVLSIQGLVPQLAAVGAVGGTATDEIERMAMALYGLQPALKAVSDSAGVTGGGKGGLFGSFFGGMKGGLSSMMQNLTGGQGFGGMLGKIGTGIFEGFGNLISGGLSSLIGGGVSLAIKGIGKLFGGGEHSKVNDMRDAYIASAGGITKLAEEAQKAGTSVDKLLAAKNIKNFQNAIAELDTQLEDFSEKQKEAEQAAEERLSGMIGAVSKFGIELADVSSEVRDKVLGDQATGLVKEWEALAEAGVNITIVQDKMQDSILAFIETALKAGSEIPESFRPMLEAILLTADYADAAALSLLSMGELAAAGLKMAANEAKKLNAELARNTYGADNDSPTQGGSVDFEPKMFDPKTGSWVTPTLASWQAAGNPSGTESQFRSAFNLDVIGAARNAGFSEEYVNNWARANGGDISRFGRAHNLPGFYGGTGGRYLNFGAGTPAMLHGRERVSTEAEGRSEAAGFEALCGSIDAMRRDFSTFPEQLRDALQTRVVVAH